jgi:hypothetical protein
LQGNRQDRADFLDHDLKWGAVGAIRAFLLERAMPAVLTSRLHGYWEGIMGPLGELLASDQRQVLEFFLLGLRDVSEPTVDRQELFYNASVLAHYAQVSTQADDEWPAPANLSTLFDHFVSDATLLCDSAMMEVAGAQCLFLAGFFEDQMRQRHNIRWYSELGTGFFTRAAAHESSPHKATLLDAIGRHFEPWRQRHARLSRELRDQQHLLAPSNPSRLM